MAAHWAFILPIAAAYLLKRLQWPSLQRALRVLLLLICVFMLVHNGQLFIHFMLH